MSLLLINRFRGENTRFHGFQLTIGDDSAKEARAIAFMARPADLPGFDQQNVGVAIDPNFSDLLNMSGRPALVPGGSSGARIKVSLPCLPGTQDRGFVHPGHHQNFAGVDVLNDSGNQAVGGSPQLGQESGGQGGSHMREQIELEE